jgi:hypothetical protein
LMHIQPTRVLFRKERPAKSNSPPRRLVPLSQVRATIVARSSVLAAFCLLYLVAATAGCALKPTLSEPERSADTSACFMDALTYCRETGTGCLDARMRACDDEMARNSPVMTQGPRSKLVSCFEQDLVQELDEPPSEVWRRCMHLLDAE